ncbi:collagen alpha-6(VI) chain-like [Gigantopelta aegis]|uniref:collagen alpha-6(VI) chain-like n=1 Tax=Gigantopelta aegis TaxID=1735272 RepID=UPI001B88DA35|nr:collagen alpha-6(VI) chain-like [Gigantopelta aegis]
MTVVKMSTTGTREVCRQAPVELDFVIDSSSSIWSVNFTIGLAFIRDFIDDMDIAQDKIRIGAVTYAEKVYEEDSVALDQLSDKSAVLEAVTSLRYRAGWYTETGMAIRYMRTQHMSQARQGVPKISIVLTDGQSQKQDVTSQEAALARDAGIIMFAVGVGNNVSREELISIAGKEDNAFTVANYSALQSIRDLLEYRTCVERMIPIPPCGESHPADIIFVFDLNELKQNKMAVHMFITEVISADRMQLGMQIGVIAGLCPIDAGFPLNQYTKPIDAVGSLAKFFSGSMSELVRQLRNSWFLPTKGGRPGVAKRAIIFIDNSVDIAVVHQQIQLGRSDGILFHVVPLDVPQASLDVISDDVTVIMGETMEESAASFVDDLCSSTE